MSHVLARDAGTLHSLTLDCVGRMPILMPVGGHVLRRVQVVKATAIRHSDGSWSEDHGDANPASWKTDGSERVEVLLVE